MWVFAAWVAVAISLSIGFVGTLRWLVTRVRDSSELQRPPPLDIDARLLELGGEIVRFAREREILKPDRTRPRGRAVRAHREDTLQLYDERFAPAVGELVLQLRNAGRVGDHEAMMMTPRNAPDIHAVGLRLIGLARARPERSSLDEARDHPRRSRDRSDDRHSRDRADV